MSTFNQETLHDLLPLYYKRLFPFRPYYRWLAYGEENAKYFKNREFSFTLVDDIYIRYRSFANQEEMEKEVYKEKPFKIDIGAVYSHEPKKHRHYPNFIPLEKELVFDIDMTDYDEVRTCCSGADICEKCWRFMAVACKVLDTALREDFGYKHLLWVFSGRRGIHCWVCDNDARKLDIDGRGAIAEYLQLISGGAFQAKKVSISGDHMHQSIKRAKKIIEQNFIIMCIEEQNILGTQKGMNDFLAIIADDVLREDVRKELKKHSTSRDRWNAFTTYIRSLLERGQLKRRSQHIVEEIMIQYAYPRLDINVSKGLNHLLKSPFCVHPKTGKICVPFNPKNVDKFSPLSVPTLSQLIEEISEFDKKEDTKIRDVKKTSMYKNVIIFEEFVRKLEQAYRVNKNDPMEF